MKTSSFISKTNLHFTVLILFYYVHAFEKNTAVFF